MAAAQGKWFPIVISHSGPSFLLKSDSSRVCGVKWKPDALLLCPARQTAPAGADDSDHWETDNNSVVYICDDLGFDLFAISGSFYIVVFILSFAGNGSIACALLLRKNRNTVTNLFILNIVCSDLLFALTLPFWSVYQLHHWVFGEAMCKLVIACYISGQYSSVLLLTAMTVDRFKTVVLQRPKNRQRRLRFAQASCVAAWLIGIAASAGDAARAKVIDDEDDWVCEVLSDSETVTLGYYLQAALLFFLPLAIIVFCYSAILKTVLRASNRKRQRTVLMVLSIVVAFFACWAPYSVFLLVGASSEEGDCHSEQRWLVAELVCRLLAFFHCCVNPALYMSSQKMRNSILESLRCKNVCVKNTGEDSVPGTSLVPHAHFNTAQTSVTLGLPAQ